MTRYDCLMISALILSTFCYAFTVWGINTGKIIESNPYMAPFATSPFEMAKITVLIWSVGLTVYILMKKFFPTTCYKLLVVVIFLISWFNFWADFTLMLLVV